MACANDLPQKLDYYIYQGQTFGDTLTWAVGTESDNTPVNLTGYTAAMKIKSGSATLIELTTENGGITLGGSAGTIALLVSAEDTAALAAPTNAVYDLLLTSAGGVVKALVAGAVTIVKGVTAN